MLTSTRECSQTDCETSKCLIFLLFRSFGFIFSDLFNSVAFYEHTTCQERIQVDFFDFQAIFTTMKLSIFRSCICMLVLHPVTSFTTLNTFAVRQTLSHARNMNLAMAADPEKKKETTWERITGPKLFKTVTNWEGIHAVPLVPLRIMTGLLMIHHGSEGEFAFQ